MCLEMDVLTFETRWAVNSEIIKQVTSSWSIFIQLKDVPLLSWGMSFVSCILQTFFLSVIGWGGSWRDACTSETWRWFKLYVQGMQCGCIVTLRRVRATIVAVEKAMNITCSECVSVSLGIQREIRMRQTVICGLPRCTIFFPHYLINGTIFEKIYIYIYIYILNIKWVFWFSLQLLSETFLILRRTERDMIRNVYWRPSCKVLFILVRF